MEELEISIKENKDEDVILLNNQRIGTCPSHHIKCIILDYGNFNLVKKYNFNDIPWANSLSFEDENFFKKFRTFPFEANYVMDKEKSFLNEHKEPTISILLTLNLLHYNLLISPIELIKLLLTKIDKNTSFIYNEAEELEELKYSLWLGNDVIKEKTIEENLYYHLSLLENIIDSILKENDKKPFSVDTFFSFPEEYKAACEQYLIYFATFLKDLGIEAKTNLENQEDSVLFKVFPKDKETALTQIKEALDIYLALPMEQNIDQAATQFPDAAVQQLMANVYHLKSQLVLANSTIIKLQDKNEKLELFQYENKQIIHLDEVNKNQKNEEQLFGGIITVKEYEGKGFNIDLPRLFRMMKRIWPKK